MRNTFILFSSIMAATLAASANAQMAQADSALSGVQAVQRALPTRITNATERAHYQHVYVDSASANAGSLQTVSLTDAVQNNVLASSDLQAKALGSVPDSGLRWVVLDKGFARPTSLEGIGGLGALATNFTEVNFPLNEVEIINADRLAALARLASRLDGVVHIVAYADESGLEASNQELSERRAKAVASALVASGINEARVTAVGAGVSRLYPGLDANRRATVVFQVSKK